MKILVFAVCALGLGWVNSVRAQEPGGGKPVVDTSLIAVPSPTPLSAAPTPATLQRTELYFGGIALLSWNDFLAQVVTPRFPDGFTWFDTHGQWQTSTGEVTKQDSRVLIILHAANPEKDRLIEEVRELFKTRFHELSVLRADAPVTASF